MIKRNAKLKQLMNTLAIVSVAWAFNANAVPVITSGIWTSLEENNGAVANISGLGTNNVSWGTPFGSSNAGPSGYTFDGVSPGDATLDNTLFELGDFTHSNFTISLPSITGATLDMNLNFTNDGVSQNFSFFFEHTETPNSSNPCAEGGVNPCPDKVVIPDASSSETVTLGGQNYQLVIAGFSQDGGNTIVSDFLTLEGQPNTATLFARLVVVPPTDASEPSAAGLLAIGLIGLWGISSYRRRQDEIL